MKSKTPSNKPMVFISYIHEEVEFAKAIEDWAKGIKAIKSKLQFFCADESIGLGEDCFEEIKSMLKQASAFLSIVSPSSIDRPWINFEAGAAFQKASVMSEFLTVDVLRDFVKPERLDVTAGKHIPVVPICIGGIELSALTPPFSTKQAVKLPDGASRLLQMLAALANVQCPDPCPPLVLPDHPGKLNAEPIVRSQGDMPKPEVQIAGAKEVWSLAITGSKLGDGNIEDFLEKPTQKWKILLLNPKGGAMDLWASQFHSPNRDINGEIKKSIEFFKRFPNATVKFTEDFVPFSMLAADPCDKTKGSIVVAFHLYKTTSGGRPYLYMKAQEPHIWYEVFKKQFLRMWKHSIPAGRIEI